MTCESEPSKNKDGSSAGSGFLANWKLKIRFFVLLPALGALVAPLCAVDIADKKLEEALRALIPGNPSGELSALDLAGVTELQAYSWGISQLGGMEYLSSLTYADLGANQNISDLSPLSGLIQLKELRLAENAIVDLSPLSTLVNLKKLWLYDNLVTDLSPLTSLTKLEELMIFGNQIEDITASKSWPSLTSYYLYENKDWKQLDWFGFFYDQIAESDIGNPYGPHWVHHVEHGWVYWNLAQDPYDFTAFWVWSEDLGWAWFQEEYYPFIWSAKKGTWMWYYKGSKNPRYFFNFSSDEWEEI